MQTNKSIFLLISIGLFFTSFSKAEPLEDNSFLVEEAYNQEPGVYQFIQSFQKNERNRTWNYNFVNEIPMGNQDNQFSYEIPAAYLESVGKTKIKDVKFNYRREFFRNEQVVITGRVSVISQSGEYKEGFGTGSTGYEGSLVGSVKINPKWSQHWNMGASITPKAKNTAGDTADSSRFFWAVSNVYFFTDSFNFMLEATGSTSTEVTGPNTTNWTNENLVSPSLRYAIDVNDWQIVPGIATPIGVASTAGQNQVLLYLSIEGHLF